MNNKYRAIRKKLASKSHVVLIGRPHNTETPDNPQNAEDCVFDGKFKRSVWQEVCTMLRRIFTK